jgi:hypothetical protein
MVRLWFWTPAIRAIPKSCDLGGFDPVLEVHRCGRRPQGRGECPAPGGSQPAAVSGGVSRVRVRACARVRARLMCYTDRWERRHVGRGPAGGPA